ncbi:glycosyltransferase family 2 protein [Myxococcota bacterium]|nr:glycosyltransferase family 2 protein [Myxococcota bacterium]MBU1432311.1 glycosyltransferase family 2 protein [Myxococcota bacterium]MBU1897573.1 glycosyltransferase family 2 protein [Myxococcota bacterium]
MPSPPQPARRVVEATAPPPSLSIVMIAFNEAAPLAAVVTELRAALDEAAVPFELILVDDGSADDTLSIMEGLADDGRTQVWTQPNGGIGAALCTGYEALRGDYATWVPADGQIAPESVLALYAHREEATMVASYYTARDDAWYRMVISKSLNALVRLRTGEWKKSGGSYIFRRQAWADYGPKGEASMVISEAFRQALLDAGEPVTEIGIKARARVAGRSKVLNPRAILRTLAGLRRMRRRAG